MKAHETKVESKRKRSTQREEVIENSVTKGRREREQVYQRLDMIRSYKDLIILLGYKDVIIVLLRPSPGHPS